MFTQQVIKCKQTLTSCLPEMLIQCLSFFFRPLATAANYSLDKELKLAEMDEQSVEVHIRH